MRDLKLKTTKTNSMTKIEKLTLTDLNIIHDVLRARFGNTSYDAVETGRKLSIIETEIYKRVDLILNAL